VDVTQLGAISDAYLCTPQVHGDDRGLFLEWFKAEDLTKAVGHRLQLEQANHSVSKRGTVRGIHFADLPPSQAKYVYCPSGAILDVVIDIRVGSPTFGAVESAVLDDQQRRAIYISEGLGHAFIALTDDAIVTYLCSTGYSPGREHGITPTDPALDLVGLADWPSEPLLSPKDTAAPTLSAAQAEGLLPSYSDCQALYASLARA
jgi:dTDP-4-dehydrorhamnose 3,5-epimerase